MQMTFGSHKISTIAFGAHNKIARLNHLIIQVTLCTILQLDIRGEPDRVCLWTENPPYAGGWTSQQHRGSVGALACPHARPTGRNRKEVERCG